MRIFLERAWRTDVLPNVKRVHLHEASLRIDEPCLPDAMLPVTVDLEDSIARCGAWREDLDRQIGRAPDPVPNDAQSGVRNEDQIGLQHESSFSIQHDVNRRHADASELIPRDVTVEERRQPRDDGLMFVKWRRRLVHGSVHEFHVVRALRQAEIRVDCQLARIHRCLIDGPSRASGSSRAWSETTMASSGGGSQGSRSSGYPCFFSRMSGLSCGCTLYPAFSAAATARMVLVVTPGFEIPDRKIAVGHSLNLPQERPCTRALGIVLPDRTLQEPGSNSLTKRAAVYVEARLDGIRLGSQTRH